MLFRSQLCNQFEGLGFNGITARFRRAPLSLIFLSLFFAGNREPDLFTAVLWTLWNRRNNLCLGKHALSLGQVVEFAQDRILEKNPCNIAFQQSRPHQITTWQASIQHAYKVNFDGAVFADEGLAGLGVVICNDHGFSYLANTSTQFSYRGGSLGYAESIGAYD